MEEKRGGYNGFTEARARANKKYMENFVEVKVRMTPEERSVIQEHAKSKSESTNTFIRRAIRETMERDQQTNK